MGAGPEERLAVKVGGIGQRHKRHRVEPVAGGKRLCLGQGFTGDHRHHHLGAVAGPVKHQIIDTVGGAPFQGLADLVAALARLGAGSHDFGVENLVIGDHQLGGDALRFQPQCGGAQIAQIVAERRIIQWRIAQRQPAAPGSMQQRDACIGKLQCKTWFHAVDLAKLPVRGNSPSPLRTAYSRNSPKERIRPKDWLAGCVRQANERSTIERMTK